MDEQANAKNSALFIRLLFSYQAAAMQQMGKFADPLTGTVVRDLDQARFTIDTLDMLRLKCKGNLNETEERLFNQIVSDLKLNFVDELSRPATPEFNTEAKTANTTDAPLTEA
jgi:hypothetical protein